VAILYALTNGFMDDVEVSEIKNWENDFHKYLDAQAKKVLALIADKKELSEEVVSALEKAIKEFKEIYAK
jgi:F-type H+-transporting ATPase subunit alpha